MSAKIYIGSKDVSVIDLDGDGTADINSTQDHLFLLYDPDTDGDNDPTTGRVQIINGYPTDADGPTDKHNAGSITFSDGFELIDGKDDTNQGGVVFDAFDTDGNGTIDITPAQYNLTVISNDSSTGIIWTDMKAAVSALSNGQTDTQDRNSSDIDYFWAGPNSNSTIATVVEAGGLDFYANLPKVGGTGNRISADNFAGHTSRLGSGSDDQWVFSNPGRVINIYDPGGNDDYTVDVVGGSFDGILVIHESAELNSDDQLILNNVDPANVEVNRGENGSVFVRVGGEIVAIIPNQYADQNAKVNDLKIIPVGGGTPTVIPLDDPTTIAPPANDPLPGWIDGVLTPFDNGKTAISPLVIDLDGDGIELTTMNAQTTQTFFDLNVDRFAEQTAWITANQDGLLAIDLNSNGIIDNSSELFGTASTDGFAVLAELDSNNDMIIDKNDALGSDLRIWKDIDGDAYTDTGELTTLAANNIASISLIDVQDSNTTINGNFISHLSTVTYEDGTMTTIGDAWLKFDHTNTVDLTETTIDSFSIALPDLRSFGTLQSLQAKMTQNSALQDNVESFAFNWSFSEFADETNVDAQATDILYRWAGVEGVSQTARGAQIGDSRVLEFLEEFVGEEWVGFGGDTNPQQNASRLLNQSFETVFEVMKAQLIFQVGGNALFSADTIFNVNTAEFEGTKALVQSEIDARVTDATATGVDTQAYWVFLADYMRQVKGFADFTSQENTWMNDAIVLSDNTLTWQGIKDIVEEIGSGVNYMYGTGAGETINGTLGDDDISAYGGDDTVNADFGDDVVRGSSGNDTLNGEEGDDELWGEAGNDALYGDDGQDYLDGGDGNDTLSMGDGGDEAWGGGGDDTYIFTGGDDLLYENDGTDVIVLPAGITLNDLTFERRGEADLFIRVGDKGTIQIVNQFTVYSNQRIETIRFADNSTFDLSTLNDLTLHGTNGDDTLEGVVYGAGGNDTIFGYAGNDIITTHEGFNTVDGGSGNDSITLSSGTNTVHASEGFDTIHANGGGTDTVVIPSAFSLADVIMYREFDPYWGSARDLNIFIDGLGQVQIDGHFSNTSRAIETLSFANGVDADIDLTTYKFLMKGTSGNDSISFDSYSDTYLFGEGQDDVAGTSGIEKIQFGAQDAFANLDIARVNNYDLKITDQDGNSISVVRHFMSSSFSIDTMLFNGGSSVDFSSIEIDAHGTENADFIEGVDAGDASTDDTVFAKGGNDSVYAGAGNDEVHGEDGDDDLYGGAGADMLYGGSGNDALYGESGADTFVFESGTTSGYSDTIGDFSIAQGDKIDIADVLISYDPMTDLIADFVEITDDGTHSYMSIDPDGGANNFVQVTQISNVTGITDVTTLENNETLVTV